jgi:hypothetical protein
MKHHDPLKDPLDPEWRALVDWAAERVVRDMNGESLLEAAGTRPPISRVVAKGGPPGHWATDAQRDLDAWENLGRTQR